MRLARYVGNGCVEIVDEPTPICPPGGILVRTEACGLCSGELMGWYMDQKIPHVLGHEVAGIVVESQDDRYPVGSRVFPHHHAPCLNCDECRKGAYVHCLQWKRTKLNPGGMAEFFAVSPDNFNDTLRVDDMDPKAAALIEPLACVMKSLRLARATKQDKIAVVGLGVMGLMHCLAAPGTPVGFEMKENRRSWANRVGVTAMPPSAEYRFDVIFVCPGSQDAFNFAFSVAAPAARIVNFAPMPPETNLVIPREAYFQDLEIHHAYSCGPNDTQLAAELLRRGTVKPDHVVSNFIELNYLPDAYQQMKAGEILKAMVLFEGIPQLR